MGLFAFYLIHCGACRLLSDEAKHEKALASAKEVGDSRQQEFEQQLELATESAEERVVQAEQRQAQAMAATADAKREVATAEDKVRELEDHVWRLEQGRGGAAEGTIQDAAQLASENFSLRQRLAQVEAEIDADERTAPVRPPKPRQTNRGSLPKHLERVEVVIEPEQSVT